MNTESVVNILAEGKELCGLESVPCHINCVASCVSLCDVRALSVGTSPPVWQAAV